jgi:hypothetical protein
LLGICVENAEPVAWAEELVGSARAVDHPRLVSLYVMATWTWTLGRIEEAIGYSDAGQTLLLQGHTAVPPGFESWLGGVFNMIGQAERTVEWSRTLVAHGRPDPYALTSSGLVNALIRTGDDAEAIELAKQLVGTADAIANPWARSYALLMYGMACCDADPLSAGEALRMGLVLAHESGNRSNESHIANVLGRLEARYGDPLAALEYLALAIHNYHDSGSFAVMRVPLASLAVLLHQLGHHEPSATIAGFALSPITKGWVPEFGIAIANLRDVLGEERYESLVRQGSAMAVSKVAAYVYDHIDQTRAELNAVSNL